VQPGRRLAVVLGNLESARPLLELARQIADLVTALRMRA
jgi:hypothetical protein